MKHGRTWAAIAAIVVLGGGSLAFVLVRAAAERVKARDQLLATVRAELRSGERDGLSGILQRVREARKTDDDESLAIAEGRLLLALGRDQAAWEVVAVPATRPGASLDAMILGAQILTSRYSSNGERALGDRAMGLAEQHARASGSGESLFLAWQLAFRTGDARAFAALYGELVEQYGTETVAAAARALVVPLGELLMTRAGVTTVDDSLQNVAQAGGPLAALAQLLLDPGEGREASEVESLERLRDRFESPPEELDLVIANARIAAVGNVDGELTLEQRDALIDASRSLETVLETWPTSVDARHAAAIVAFAEGEASSARCQGQVQWLLEKAAPDDLRRPIWEALRQR